MTRLLSTGTTLSVLLLLAAPGCHKDARRDDSGATAQQSIEDKSCKSDAECGPGNLCHPSRNKCASTYPDARLLNSSNDDLKKCDLANVYFSFDSADLSADPNAKAWLDYNVRCAQAHGAPPLVVEGYADARGEEGYNVDLSNRRAMAVKQYLDQSGVRTVEVAAKGTAKPITTGTTEQDYAWNRRVELRMK